MVVIEYLGGVPRRPAAARVEASVRDGMLHLKQGDFLRGWTCRVPLTTITGAELATARDVGAAGIQPLDGRGPLGDMREYLLAIEAPLRDGATTIILRGPPATLERLRQEILRGRMRAAKQWRS
ncbi:MAG: hypothetical protein AVDCRST_MAG88-3874 [uncultured Thermomicrobiales bacterium]|uniref:Uncharacterized protein n=1 Tax=uncultured Thermomicrobiales bacterium TaxID=1645740 RepID=A0A6J4VR91_9BACT|nr:MAG: hypothetical protein AVDCRST_MAG88-3874 [uncultured Thermomicrobiales bacterium]